MSQALLPPSGDAVLEGLAVPVAADGDPLPRAVPRAAALDGAAHPGAGVAILPPGEADPHPDLERQRGWCFCFESEDVGARLDGGQCQVQGGRPGSSIAAPICPAVEDQARAKEQSEILRLKREAKALMKRTAAEEPLPSAGKKRKKVITTPVTKELIEFMIAKPHKPLDGFPEEKLATFSQEIREFYAKRKAIADKVLEYEQALIKQFEKRDYAEDYTEVEVTDNEDN